MSTEKSAVVLEGPLHTWSISPDQSDAREYVVVTVPFGLARTVFKPDRFSAATGRGEQRDLHPRQVKLLREAMLLGKYTPTPVAAGLRGRHRKDVERTRKSVKIPVNPGDPLPLTDGQQRMGALASIYDDAKAAGDEELMRAVENAPVTATVLLDGDTQADFINLQLGQAVDPSLMLSLKVQAKLLGERDMSAMRLAMDVAKVLNTHEESPFAKLMRLDGRGAGQRGAALAKLPLSTLAARGASDLATSLCGLSRVGGEEANPDLLAYAVVAAYRAVRDQAPALLGEGLPLTPPAEGGTKGSATCLVGLGVCLAYRLKALGRELPEEDDLKALVRAAKRSMAKPVDGNFSGGVKRTLMGEFAAEFLADLKEEKHEGVPLGLLRDLSCSTFGVSPIPLHRKPVKPRKKAAEAGEAAG